MAIVRPFKALRYSSMSGSDLGSRLLAHPTQLADFDRRNEDPLHTAHLLGAPDPGSAMRQWLASGSLVEDGGAAFYLLEIQQTTAGVARPPARFLLCGLQAEEGVVELEEGSDRPTQASLEPVLAVAADDQHVLRGLLSEAAGERAPDWGTHAGDQAISLWKLPSSGLWGRIQEHLEDVKVRPLAPVPTDAPCLGAILPLSDPGLSVQPIHRGIRNVATFQLERFLTVVKDYARVYEIEAPLTTADGMRSARERLASLATGNHAVLLVLPDGQGKILRFRQGLNLSQFRAVPKSPTLRSLDLALLNALVFRTVLGISEPEAIGHPNVFAVPGIDQLVDQVQRGVFQAGFALNPPPLWELRAVMEAEQQLPPRTMVVEPRPPAGLLFLTP